MDRASVSLADDWQDTVQTTQTGHKYRKNTLEELRRKHLQQNKARKTKMRQMSKKDKRTLIQSKMKQDLEAAHQKEIAELTNSVEHLIKGSLSSSWMNSPIPSLLLPLWQNDSLCETTGMKICHLYSRSKVIFIGNVLPQLLKHMEPPKTSQNQPKPRKPSQNNPNPCTIYLITTGLCDTCVDAVCVTLPDYHVEIFSTLDIVFYIAIKNFTLKLSRQVKVFSLAENKPADIFLQLRLMSS